MNKKFKGIAIGALLLVGTTSFTVLAKIPNFTAVIENRAFDLNYLMKATKEENDFIRKHVVSGKEIFIKKLDGTWMYNSTNEPVKDIVKEVPEVEYKDAKGVIKYYRLGDGDRFDKYPSIDTGYIGDVMAPTVTLVESTRVSNESAIVNFTINESGKYYIAVANKEDKQPTINTSEGGIPYTSGGVSVKVSLTEGAKDVYLVAKDSSGNGSMVSKVTIEAYTPPKFLEGYPLIKDEDTLGVNIESKLDEKCKMYVVLMKKGHKIYTSMELKECKVDGNNIYEKVELKDLQENTLITQYFDKLKKRVEYEIYLVAEDSEGNLQENPVKLYYRIPAEAADKVVEKINAIGEVKYTTECKEKIDGARSAYDALTPEDKALINEAELKILTDAEAQYAYAKEHGIHAYGNEFEIGTMGEFKTGIFSGVEEAPNVGDGALVIAKDEHGYKKEGIYTSQEIDVPNFEYMVSSWNADTPEGTYVEVQARVLVNHFNENNEPIQAWSDWLSWGTWSPFLNRASADTDSPLAKTSTDELVIKGSDGETASKVQLKVIMGTENPGVTPILRYLHGTLKNTLEGQAIEKAFKEEIDISNLDKDIATPEYSQMIRCPRIRNLICSATTTTMMMNRFGEILLPEEVAQNSYDNSYGFGNWAFAVAAAGSYGYKAYADYSSIEGLKREIAKGYPVGVSVKYSNVEGDKYPYIEGAPGRTGGHLIVVKGFTTIDDVEYVIVNDSYAPENETVRRLYKLEQFEKAWSNRLAYIIHDKESNAGEHHTKRIGAQLRATDIPNEYKVFVGEENIDVQNFGGTIAYTLDNDKTYKYFPKIKDKNSLTFTEDEVNSGNLKVYVITDIGKVYLITEQIQLKDLNVVSVTTSSAIGIKVNMDNIPDATFTWNGSILEKDKVSVYEENGFKITVPEMISGEKNTLKIFRAGYKAYVKDDVIWSEPTEE